MLFSSGLILSFSSGALLLLSPTGVVFIPTVNTCGHLGGFRLILLRQVVVPRVPLSVTSRCAVIRGRLVTLRRHVLGPWPEPGDVRVSLGHGRRGWRRSRVEGGSWARQGGLVALLPPGGLAVGSWGRSRGVAVGCDAVQCGAVQCPFRWEMQCLWGADEGHPGSGGAVIVGPSLKRERGTVQRGSGGRRCALGCAEMRPARPTEYRYGRPMVSFPKGLGVL